MRKVREVGPITTAGLIAGRLLPPAIFHVERTILLELNPHAIAHAENAAHLRWAGLSDSATLEAFGHPPAVLQRRFSSGGRACMLTDGARLLGYVWFHGGQHEERALGVRFRVAPRDIWLFDAMVAPEERGRGLYPQLLCGAARELAREGVRRILIAVAASNRNSLRAHDAAGAREIGRLRALRLLGFTALHDGRCWRAAWTGAAGALDVSTAEPPVGDIKGIPAT